MSSKIEPFSATKVRQIVGSVTLSVMRGVAVLRGAGPAAADSSPGVMPAGLAWCSLVVAGECCCRVLLPDLSPVVIDDIDCVGGAVMIAAHPRARGSRCRRCGRVSTRVHSRYRRQLADLPVAGRPVAVWLTVRRFFCDHVDCSAGTFAEQMPGLTERHARRSPGLQAALVAIALALTGRPGSRLAARLGMAVSRSTLLRMIRGLPDSTDRPGSRPRCRRVRAAPRPPLRHGAGRPDRRAPPGRCVPGPGGRRLRRVAARPPRRAGDLPGPGGRLRRRCPGRRA